MKVITLQFLFSSLHCIHALWTPETIVAKSVYVPTLNSVAYVGITHEYLCSSGKATTTSGNPQDLHCQDICFSKCPTNSFLASSYGSDAARDQERCLEQYAPDCHFVKYEVMLLPTDLTCAKPGGMMQLRLPPDLSYILYNQVAASEALQMQLHVSSQTQQKGCDSGTMPFTLVIENAPINRCTQYGGIPSDTESLGDLRFTHVTRTLTTEEVGAADKTEVAESLMILDVPQSIITNFTTSVSSTLTSRSTFLSVLPYGCCSQSPVLNETLIGGAFKLFTGPSKDENSLNSEGYNQKLSGFSVRSLLVVLVAVVMLYQ